MGGRMSMRRAEPFAFDHGAQYFTARGDGFQRFLAPFRENNVVVPWQPKVVVLGGSEVTRPYTDPADWLVPQPGMNSLCKVLSDGIDVQNSADVGHLQRDDGDWRLRFKDGAMDGAFDLVLSTAPSTQTGRIFPAGFGGDTLSRSRMSGCFSLMLGFAAAKAPEWDVARVENGPLAWVAVNSRKPGRDVALSILCQSGNRWAEDNLERDQAAVREDLMSDFRKLTGITAVPDYINLHRWRFAKVERAAGAASIFDATSGLGAAGDWCGAGRVEAAFDSAVALAEAVSADLARAV
jgi:predicted NAD/FAD-dependent oxidoreductase